MELFRNIDSRIPTAVNVIIYKDVYFSGLNRREFSIKLGEELCALEWRSRDKMPHLLRLKHGRDGGGEDLPPHKGTKCSNKIRTKCGNCYSYVCSTCSTSMCKECINLEKNYSISFGSFYATNRWGQLTPLVVGAKLVKNEQVCHRIFL